VPVKETRAAVKKSAVPLKKSAVDKSIIFSCNYPKAKEAPQDFLIFSVYRVT
jgi:hypothetical protein